MILSHQAGYSALRRIYLHPQHTFRQARFLGRQKTTDSVNLPISRGKRHVSNNSTPSSKSVDGSTVSSGQTAATATPSAQSASKTIPGPAYFWLDSLSAPLRFYARAHAKRPYVTQLLSSLTIYLLGDLSAQNLTPTDPDDKYSPARTLRALITGGLAAIPGYKWFLWLGESFNYRSKILSLAVKVTVNQITFTPLFNCYFFGMQSALTGANLDQIMERIKNTVPESWINSLKLWPAVIAFSFAFIPLHYRSIFAGGIAIGWQTYLSFLNQQAAKLEKESKIIEATLESVKTSV